MKWINRFFWVALTAVFVLLFTACKTTPKIDWASRIGVFTYDQAVFELGPPDKMTKISTGSVADWVTARDRGPTFSLGVGSYGSGGGVGVGTGAGGNVTEKVLRLTFDEEDKLVAWENTTR
jgi:hypothetical protein